MLCVSLPSEHYMTLSESLSQTLHFAPIEATDLKDIHFSHFAERVRHPELEATGLMLVDIGDDRALFHTAHELLDRAELSQRLSSHPAHPSIRPYQMGIPVLLTSAMTEWLLCGETSTACARLSALVAAAYAEQTQHRALFAV